MEEILSNLDYFSGVTQRTLSAFHVAGTDTNLTDEIDSIKRYITKLKLKTLIKVEICENNLYRKIYSDGSYEIVEEEAIIHPSSYVNNKYDFSVIEKALAQKPSHITKIKISNKIDLVENKLIERPSEIIFFM